jgi:hypothetical protein
MKAKYLLLAMIAVGIISLAAKKAFTADELVGTWKYTVSNVPPEYETGFMTFEQKDGKLTGYLGQTERSEMKELTVDQGKVTFKLDFQGGLLTMTGVISSQDGEFPISAVKDAPKN